MVKIIAANWKEHKTNEETLQFIDALLKNPANPKHRAIIAPSFVSLKDAKTASKNSWLKIAAQNMFYEEEGAFTGEVSARMIKPFCDYAIIGHSERRIHFYETDEDVNKKVLKAIEHGIIPIICVGESCEARDNGETFKVIGEMVDKALEGVKSSDFIIAYEPVWAISGGRCDTKPATPEDAEEVHKFIKERLGRYGEIKVIYGGSIKPENIDYFLEKENIDGALIGGASLNVDSFIKMIN